MEENRKELSPEEMQFISGGISEIPEKWGMAYQCRACGLTIYDDYFAMLAHVRTHQDSDFPPQ